MEDIVLNKEEIIVCKILCYAVDTRRGICDPTDFSEVDKEILKSFETKGYLRSDKNCIIIKKEFKDFLEEIFGCVKNGI